MINRRGFYKNAFVTVLLQKLLGNAHTLKRAPYSCYDNTAHIPAQGKVTGHSAIHIKGPLSIRNEDVREYC